jgi:hypothetical protein
MSKASLNDVATALLMGPRFESWGRIRPRNKDKVIVKGSIVVSIGNFKI